MHVRVSTSKDEGFYSQAGFGERHSDAIEHRLTSIFVVTCSVYDDRWPFTMTACCAPFYSYLTWLDSVYVVISVPAVKAGSPIIRILLQHCMARELNFTR